MTKMFCVDGTHVNEWTRVDGKWKFKGYYGDMLVEEISCDAKFGSRLEANRFIIRKSVSSGSGYKQFSGCEFYDEIVEELKYDYPEEFI